MKESLKKLMDLLPDDADGAIITSDLNRRYLTDMKSSAGTLVFTRTAAAFIIDFRYIEKARSVITDYPVILQDGLFTQIASFFAEQKASRISIEADTMTMSEYHSFCEKMPSLTLLSDNRLSGTVNKLRAHKTPEEISFIQSAQDITDKTFSHILDFIKPGVTEREVAVEMEYFMRKNGASSLAFDSIVVSGVNSSLPHGVPSDKKIENGDFVTMDFGAAYNGYCSDMTRTVAVGKISEEQKHVYDTVLTAHLMAAEAVLPGKRYCDIDKVARDYIYQNGYEGCFGHGLGHSLGLFIHEEPRFSMTCDEIIEPGVIETIEPGIYLEGKFGVRIEDTVLITENGIKSFAHSEKKLITL